MAKLIKGSVSFITIVLILMFISGTVNTISSYIVGVNTISVELSTENLLYAKAVKSLTKSIKREMNRYINNEDSRSDAVKYLDLQYQDLEKIARKKESNIVIKKYLEYALQIKRNACATLKNTGGEVWLSEGLNERMKELTSMLIEMENKTQNTQKKSYNSLMNSSTRGFWQTMISTLLLIPLLIFVIHKIKRNEKLAMGQSRLNLVEEIFSLIIGKQNAESKIETVENTAESYLEALQELLKKKDELDKEKQKFDAVKKILLSTIPKEFKYDHINVSAFYRACDGIGGDCYNIINTPKTTYIVIGDVSGHTSESAFSSLAFYFATQIVMTEGAHYDLDVLMYKINKHVYNEMNKSKDYDYITFCLVALSRTSNTMQWTGAHVPILKKKGFNVESLEYPSGLIWLGLNPKIKTGKDVINSTELLPGEKILLYTDGITEAYKGGNREIMFEEKGLIDLFVKEDDAVKIYESVISEYTVDDDVAIMIVEKK